MKKIFTTEEMEDIELAIGAEVSHCNLYRCCMDLPRKNRLAYSQRAEKFGCLLEKWKRVMNSKG